MTADTFVLPSHPPRSGPLPDPGTYRAEPDRCILEISASFGPLTALRSRFPVRESRLVIAPEKQDSKLTVEAERKRRPFRFASTGFTPTESGGLSISGELSVRDEPVPITLRTRVVRQGFNRLLIIGTGVFGYDQVGDFIPFVLPGRLRLLLAADFR